MLTSIQAEQFIDDSGQTLNRLFEALREYRALLGKAQESMEDIETAQSRLSDLFMYRDQWSANASRHYALYMKDWR